MLYRIGVGIAVVLGTSLSLLIALVFLGALIDDNGIEQTPGIYYINTNGECRLGMSGAVYDQLTEEEYEEELRKLGCMPEENIQSLLSQFNGPEKRAREAEQQERWEERTEHWEHVNAFWSHIARITDDEIVESSESLFICGVVTQWVRQLNAAQVYAQDWQRDYHEENSLAKLEEFATAGHRLTAGFQTDCNQLQ